MAATPSGPGLLNVRGNVTDPTVFPVDVFHKWYEEVHIPDVFKSGSIRSAARYVAPHPESTDKPYIALYPLRDIGCLLTDEFKDVPVHHEWVPGPSHNALDFTEFDIRYYSHLRDFEGNNSGKKGPSSHVITIAFDAPMSHENDHFDSFMRDTYLNVLRQDATFRRLSLYWVSNPGENHLFVEQAIVESPRYYAVVLFDSEGEPDVTSSLPGQIIGYKLRRAFGDAENEF